MGGSYKPAIDSSEVSACRINSARDLGLAYDHYGIDRDPETDFGLLQRGVALLTKSVHDQFKNYRFSIAGETFRRIIIRQRS